MNSNFLTPQFTERKTNTELTGKIINTNNGMIMTDVPINLDWNKLEVTNMLPPIQISNRKVLEKIMQFCNSLGRDNFFFADHYNFLGKLINSKLADAYSLFSMFVYVC